MIECIPRMDQETENLYVIKGRVPNLLNLPQGCRFSPRCPYATELCKSKQPNTIDIGDGHSVACHNIDIRLPEEQ